MSQNDETAPGFDPLGSIAKNPIKAHLPIGTLEEVRALGLPVAEYGTCCNSDGPTGQVRGCYMSADCPFTDDGVGGYDGELTTNFKGEGPKMVGYYHRTSKADGAREMESEVPCYVFTQVLLERMRHGQDQATRKKDHELIQIVAVEGDGERIIKRHIVPSDPAKSKLGTDLTEKSVVTEELVKKFPRPGDNPGKSYEQKLRGRQLERKAKRDAQNVRLSRAELKARVLENDDPTVNKGEPKRRGRPPGTKNKPIEENSEA